MRRVELATEDTTFEITWLEVLLVVTVMSLTIQLFPDFYSITAAVIAAPFRFVFRLFDIRQWTWRSYAVANILALVALGVVRHWTNRE